MPLEPWALEFTPFQRHAIARDIRELHYREFYEWGITKSHMNLERQHACISAFLFGVNDKWTPGIGAGLCEVWFKYWYDVQDSIRFAQILIRRGVPIDTVLIHSLREKKRFAIKAMLKLAETHPQHAAVNTRHEGETALFLAIRWRSVPFVAALSALSSGDVLNCCHDNPVRQSALEVICTTLVEYGGQHPAYDSLDDVNVYVRMTEEILRRSADDGSGVCLRPGQPIFARLLSATALLEIRLSRALNPEANTLLSDKVRQIGLISEKVHAAATRQAAFRANLEPTITASLSTTCLSGFAATVSSLVASYVLSSWA